MTLNALVTGDPSILARVKEVARFTNEAEVNKRLHWTRSDKWTLLAVAPQDSGVVYYTLGRIT